MPQPKTTNQERQMLTGAYRNTNYIVETAPGEITIRIGQRNDKLDRLLGENNAACWAFVTAHNPRSRELPKDENERRQTDLLAHLKTHNLLFLPARGESPTNEWNAEPSVLVFNLTREAAVALGRQFEQNAVVFGELNGEPELLWCE